MHSVLIIRDIIMHNVVKDFQLQSFALEPFPLLYLPHNRESISEMWLQMCANAHGIDNDHMPLDITIDGASNMVTAGCHSSGWFWIWCVYHILQLMMQAGWYTIQGKLGFIPHMKKFLTQLHRCPTE